MGEDEGREEWTKQREQHVQIHRGSIQGENDAGTWGGLVSDPPESEPWGKATLGGWVVDLAPEKVKPEA